MAQTTADSARLDSEAGPDYRIEVSNVDTGVLRRITAMAFAHRWRMAMGIGATLAAGTFQLFVLQFLGRAVD